MVQVLAERLVPLVYRADLPSGLRSAVVNIGGRVVVLLARWLTAVERDVEMFRCIADLTDPDLAKAVYAVSAT